MTRKLILSIDGGGIRGIVPAMVLANLAVRLEARGVRRPLHECFDLIAGTSTGGIIAAGLACPRPGAPGAAAATPFELAALYRDEGRSIFRRSWRQRLRSGILVSGLRGPRYSARPLAERLRARLGEARLSQALTGVMMTAYDVEARRAVFMTNGKERDARPADDYLFHEAALATASAPTFFPPVQVRNLSHGGTQALIDGGVFANDPAIAAFVEGRKLGWTRDDITVLSLGTGYANRAYRFEDVRGWGLFSWVDPDKATPILSIMMQGQASTASYQAAHLLNADGDRPGYWRIDAELDGPSDEIDDASEANVDALEAFAGRLIGRHDAVLERVAGTVAERFSDPVVAKSPREK